KDPEQRFESARQLQADLAELARRHPVKETVRLRIDAVAPTLAPSDTVRATTGGLGAVRPHIPRNVLLGLGLVILFLVASGGAFGVVKHLQNSAASARAAALQSVEDLEALAGSDPERAEIESKDLAERLGQEGYPELAERAVAVGAKIAQSRADERQQAQADEAARKLETAEKLFEQHGASDPADQALRQRLEEILRLAAAVITDYPQTEAAQKAQVLSQHVQEALEVTIKAQKARQRKENAARRALTQARERVKELLAQRRKGCFAEAAEVAQNYVEAHGEVEPIGGQELLREVERTTRSEVRARIRRSRDHLSRQEWSQAEVALESVLPPLGDPKLERQVRDAVAAIAQARRSASEARERETQRKAQAVLDRARGELKDELTTRRYGDAASQLRSVLTTLELQRAPGVKRLGELRVQRLERAQQALDGLAAHVRQGKEPPLTLSLEAPDGEVREARAVKYDGLQRRFTFQFTAQMLEDKKLAELTPEQLLTLLQPLGGGAKDLLARACLAYEVGALPQAEQLLGRARALDPGLARTVDDLRALEGQ
ncbi:MAG TPA: hypothetical protein DEA08_16130, partial [Planctomycetes bacterium]|nr:hypothetical protein [Planctomycetota bacterium]